MTFGLTKQQAACLRFIQSYIEQNGYSPNYDEIAEKLGFASKSASHRIVKMLIDRGAVTMIPHRGRSLAVVTQLGDLPKRDVFELPEDRRRVLVARSAAENARKTRLAHG